MKKNKNINNWIVLRKKKILFLVKKKNLSELKNWHTTTDKIYHKSKKFFHVVGVRIKTNFHKKKSWDQPLIFQNEIGILGILRRKNKGNFQYLLQAKMEPGNINKLQLSPTVQATKSNFTRVHSGKRVKYLNFFKNLKKKKILVNTIQSEQGSRYLFKFNKNIIINVSVNIKLNRNYIWLTRHEIGKLIKKNNVLNMDSISVLSCAIKKNIHDLPENYFSEIQYWFNNLKKKYFIKRKMIALSKLRDWKFDKKSIFHKSKKYFSIIGIKVQADSREVNKWEQPIIQDNKLGLSGFLVKNVNSTYHYLVNFSLEPGLKSPGLSCTVRTSNVKNCLNNRNHTSLMKHYLKKYFIYNTSGKIKYSKILSDEGGRFFHSQNKYVVIQIDENERIKTNNNYIWMSHNQLLYFIKKGIFNIDARLLFASFNIKNIL